LAIIVSAAWLAFLIVARNWAKLLWRVRRKLIASYLILGLVPVVLVLLFTLVGGVVLYDNVAAYLFRQGLDDVIEDVHQIAETAAIEIGRNPNIAATVITNRYLNRASRFPELSLAVVPIGAAARPAAVVTAGAWRHLKPP